MQLCCCLFPWKPYLPRPGQRQGEAGGASVPGVKPLPVLTRCFQRRGRQETGMGGAGDRYNQGQG